MSEHEEFDLLDAYALGTLDPGEAARIEAHVRDCPTCRREYDELRPVLDVLPNALHANPAPAGLRDRILAAVAEPSATSSPGRGPQVPILGALAAALVLALIGDAYFALAARSAAGGVAPIVVLQPTPLPPRPSAAPGPQASAIRPATAPSGRDARAEAARIATLERRLAAAQRSAGADAVRIERLERELAQAQRTPRIVRVVVAPARPARTAVPVAVATRPPITPAPVASTSSAAGAEAAELIAALRTGKVYGVDGVVGTQPWHLTIVQPRNGDRALIFSGTPGAPAGDTYRTWVIRSGRTVDIGELPPDKPSTLQMPMALQPGDVIAFSREPVGSGDLPTQPFLMQFTVPQ